MKIDYTRDSFSEWPSDWVKDKQVHRSLRSNKPERATDLIEDGLVGADEAPLEHLLLSVRVGHRVADVEDLKKTLISLLVSSRRLSWVKKDIAVVVKNQQNLNWN